VAPRPHLTFANVNLTPYHLVISREAGALSGTSRSCTRLARLI